MHADSTPKENSQIYKNSSVSDKPKCVLVWFFRCRICHYLVYNLGNLFRFLANDVHYLCYASPSGGISMGRCLGR